MPRPDKLSLAACALGTLGALLMPSPAAGQDGAESPARLRSWALPTLVPADEPFGVHYEYENNSEDPWSGEDGYALLPVPAGAGTTWSVAEVALRAGEVVEPGARKVFAFTLRAPATPGRHPFQWHLAQDGERVGEAPPEVTIEVVAKQPDVDYEPVWFRHHKGSFEPSEQRPLSLRTDDGQPLFLLGKSAFGLLARRGSSTYLEEAFSQGYNMVRVFLLAPDIATDPAYAGNFDQHETGWPWKQDASEFDMGDPRPKFWNRLDTLMDQADEHGMVVELTLFTARALTYFEDPTEFDAAKQEYVRQIVRRLGDREDEGRQYRSRQGQAYFEVIDEYQTPADGPGPFPHAGVSAEFVTAVAEFVRQEEADLQGIPLADVQRVVTVSGLPSEEPVFPDAEWNGVLNLHLPATEGWATRIHDVMRGLRERGKPMVDDRSVGVGEGLPDEVRDDDPELHRLRLWGAAMAGGFATYHSASGIPAAAGDTPGAGAAAPLRTFIERLDHWVMEPNPDFILEADADLAWGLSSRTQLAAYLRPSAADGSGTLRIDLPQRGRLPVRYEVRWFDPVEGRFLDRRWLDAGEHTLDLPGLTPDVALVATSLVANRTPALVALQPNCLPLEYDGQLTLRGQDFLPGIHALVDGIGPVPLTFSDGREASLDMHRHLGYEFDRDRFRLVEGTFVMRVRNYHGLTSAPHALRIVADHRMCEPDFEPDAGGLDSGTAPDVGGDTPDAGTGGDTGPDAGPDGGDAPSTDDGARNGGDGCGCMAVAGTPATDAAAAWLLVGLVGGAALRRRYRRSSHR